ncbi:MAG: tetratricopeptide repeat protein [Planctomycetota bacterium]|jgi:tetratricopeptide (TPR) repeat protein
MDIAKFLEKAQQALRKRNAEQAIALYRQVLVAKPGHGPARQGLMGAYRRRAELKNGPSMLEKAAAKSVYAASLGLRSSKRWAAVVKSCDAALEKNPYNGQLVALLGEGLEALGHKEEALAAWRAQVDADDSDVLALKAAGRLHYELRQIPEAIECLERAHALDKHDPEVERLRKNLAAEGTLANTRYETATSSRDVIKDKEGMRRLEAEQRGHGERAATGDLDALREQFLSSPDSVDVRRRMVKAFSAAGRHDEAIAALDAALATREGDEALQEARGDLTLAVNEAALRLAATGGDAETLKRLKAERTALEVEEFGRRVRLHPGDAGARVRLARAHYRSGDTDHAIEHFQAAIVDPRFKLDSQQGLGACFVRKGLFPLAARQFEAALEASGGVGGEKGKEICYHLGLVAERMNDRSGALARYLAVYEVDINYRDVAKKIEELSPEGS